MFIEKSSQLAFMLAKLFLTIFARKAFVCAFHKSFGVFVIQIFPFYEKNDGNSDNTDSKDVVHKHKRRKHHGVIPIIYTARCTAFVFHNPRVERAEEKNTYHIANGIAKTDKN